MPAANETVNVPDSRSIRLILHEGQVRYKDFMSLIVWIDIYRSRSGINIFTAFRFLKLNSHEIIAGRTILISILSGRIVLSFFQPIP